MHDILVIGAGIFGITAALELNARGHATAVVDPGPLPHPLAASTDISKVVRMEYGTDLQYMEMVEQALPGWRDWNTLLGDTLFHEIGVTMLTRAPMQPGGFEYESYRLAIARGHASERLTAAEIERRFPAWKPGAFVDGFYNPAGGFAESGRVVATLIALAQQQGVALIAGETVTELVMEHGRFTHALTQSGKTLSAGQVLVAAGAWTPLLVPDLAPAMVASGHPVFHLIPPRPERFTPPQFVVFTADISNSGWYGFPLHPHDQVVKIANHGVGQRLHPSHDERVVTAADVAALRTMLANTFPELVDAPIVYTRRCLYCDTRDEHLWIARHPAVAGLSVAAGGSGHGFKFAPVLGGLIADAVEGRPNPWLPKFAWRDVATAVGEEASRHHG